MPLKQFIQEREFCIKIGVSIHLNRMAELRESIDIYWMLLGHFVLKLTLPWNFGGGECVLTTAYLINRTLNTILKEQTLFEVLLNKKSCYDDLKVFAYFAFVYLRSKPKDKFTLRIKESVSVGYPYG